MKTTIGFIICILFNIYVLAQSQAIPPQLEQTFTIGRQNYALWWYGVALVAIRANASVTATTGPLLPTRTYAILCVAIHDAVNAFNPIYESYLTPLTTSPPPGAEIDAAIAGAGFQTLMSLYPNRIPDFTIVYRTQLALLRRRNTGNLHTDIRAGFQFGRRIGASIYATRANDGAIEDLFVPYNFTFQPGTFTPSPPFFLNPPLGGRWGFTVPWTTNNIVQFRPPGPPFGTPRYPSEYLEIYEKGSIRGIEGVPVTRTTLETYTAIFFAVELPGQSTPPGQYIETAYLIARDAKLNRAETARFMALTALAQADAGISAWDAKYFYGHWRPLSAVVNNTNSSLPSNPNWYPLLEVTPPFPDYVSGHSTFGGAVTQIWQNYFGTDNYRFRVFSDSLPGVQAIYNSFSQYAIDNAFSRIYAGVHFRSSCFDGVVAGRAIANHVFQNFLRPLQ